MVAQKQSDARQDFRQGNDVPGCFFFDTRRRFGAGFADGAEGWREEAAFRANIASAPPGML
jgi:hypothetical protein